MKNTLADLNNHLFEQLERLNDEELTGEELEREIQRSKSITAVAKTIIENGALALDAKNTRMNMDKEMELIFHY